MYIHIVENFLLNVLYVLAISWCNIDARYLLSLHYQILEFVVCNLTSH